MITEKYSIAWQILYEIMVKSVEPLRLTQLHPGGGLYNCLALLKSVQDEPLLMINTNGSSIKIKDTLISPYDEMFKLDKENLIKRIARECRISLKDVPIREIIPLEFFLELLEHEITIDSAWLDSSYENHLLGEVRKFSAYPLSDIDTQSQHLPWWLLSLNNSGIAMCNIETGELIMRSGIKYELKKGDKQEAIEFIKKNIEWETVISQAKYELQTYTEWQSRYEGYVDEILSNIDLIKDIRKRFREWKPLKFYIDISRAKKAKATVWLDVRFLGQKIADLKCAKSEVKLRTSNNICIKNKRFFGCELCLSDVDWNGVESREFRRFFRNLYENGRTSNKGNEEHRIESLILTELSRYKDKVLRNMAPVTISGVRFPMPTPLKASDHSTVTYAKQHGGGIDVFARAGSGGINTTLCIMELKDENKLSEPPKDAIKQALIYTTFIRELLRSESGDKWWKLFGFGGEIPKKLVLNAVCVMPSNINNDTTFKEHYLSLGGDDIARLQYIYFTEVDNKIVDVIKSF